MSTYPNYILKLSTSNNRFNENSDNTEYYPVYANTLTEAIADVKELAADSDGYNFGLTSDTTGTWEAVNFYGDLEVEETLYFELREEEREQA